MSNNSTTAGKTETIVYVAPDSGAGHGPAGAHQCRSLEEAVSKAREIRANSGDSVRIVLSGGRHVILKSVNINEDDSGSEATPFIIEGDVNKETVITGGHRLEGFVPAAESPHSDRLPAESRSSTWVCDLRKNGLDRDWGQLVPRFGCGKKAVSGDQPWPEIYYNGTPLTLTRWPFDEYVHIGQVLQSEHTTNNIAYDTPGVFSVEEAPALNRWKASFDSGDVWTTGMWSWLWNCSTLPLARVDYVKGTITHGLPAPYGLRSGKPFYFTNLLEELRYPGQYYIDRQTGMLYVVPPEGEPAPDEAVVELAYASKPFIQTSQASYVTIRNLSFECNQAEVITVRGGESVSLERCQIHHLSGTAIRIEGGSNHRIVNCHLHTLGAGGIVLNAGDRGTLSPGNCLIENCRIHDFARINQAYAPAINIQGCGNRVRHCEIFNSPHHAIRVAGDNHCVELCSFHHLVLEFDDQAPLEMFGNPYYRGNCFRWNSFHHIGGGQTQEGQAGIRLDDYISAVEIYGNVFFGVGNGTFGAVQLHGGKDTRVHNNLFINCQAMVSFSPWGEERWLNSLETWTFGDINLELSEARLTVYPDLLHVDTNYDRNFVTGNISLGCQSATLDDQGQNVLLDNLIRTEVPDWPIGNNSLPEVDFSDPLFKEMNFKPIPIKDIGCYRVEETVEGGR